MTRLVVMNDIHYSRTEPECREATYSREILDKLHAVAHIARSVGAKAIACTGDWFHRKGRVTFQETNDILSLLSSWRDQGIEPIGILGNHDIAGHSLESLDTRAAGALVHSHILRLLDHGPWTLNNADGDLHVTGTSYFHGCDDTDERRIRMYGATRPTHGEVHIHLAHGVLIQSGTFFENFTTAESLIPLLHEADRLPDVIISGHLHFKEPIRQYEAPDGRTITVCRIGSVARVSADDLTRIPCALVLAIKGRRVICREVPIGKSLQKVADTSEGQDPVDAVRPDYGDRIREFVRCLRTEADAMSLVDHRQLIERMGEQLGMSPDVIAHAIRAVEKRQ